jgi:hypothetical protein
METPENYSRFLEKYGGLNPLGEPQYILQWGQSAIHRLAVPDAFIGPYMNCWCLCEWTAPEEFGSPDDWDERFWGSYPNRGAYLPLQVFRIDGEPAPLDSEYLNLEVLKLFLHVILEHRHDSLQKRFTFLKEESAKIKAAQAKQLIDRIEDGAPAWLDAVSFHGQENVNSVVKQKMEYLEKHFDRIADIARRFPRGGIVQGGI